MADGVAIASHALLCSEKTRFGNVNACVKKILVIQSSSVRNGSVFTIARIIASIRRSAMSDESLVSSLLLRE